MKDKQNKRERFRIGWYAITMILLTGYNLCNWSSVTDFTFFKEFNGSNLLFIVWIVLWVLLCIGKFKGKGFEFASPSAEYDETTAAAEKAIASQTTPEQLKNEFSAIVKAGGGNEE